MTRGRFDGLLLFILGSLMFVGVGTYCEHISAESMVDFKALDYGARCLLQHCDPYREADLLRVYQTEHTDQDKVLPQLVRVVTLYVNLPPMLLLVAPFAMLPWGAAHLLWMFLTATGFILAAFLMWDLGAAYAPAVSGGLIGLFLFGSELLLEIGNTAGIAVSLCVIAVWCFLKGRFVPAGIVCMALSLAMKPHVAGPVWLYFLLAAGGHRRRALQTMAVTAVLSVAAVLWVWHTAPHFITELGQNMRTISARGNMNDPGPASLVPQRHGAIMVSLQTVISVFRDDPHFYNRLTYLLCAPLLLLWALISLRKNFSLERACLALAAIAPLSMLPLYHRLHDMSLLLLIFPAFALLWAKGGPTSWLALLFTCASSVMTSDIPIQALAIFSAHLRGSTTGPANLILMLVLERPVPFVLFATGVFYLWAYLWRTSDPATCASEQQAVASALPSEAHG